MTLLEMARSQSLVENNVVDSDFVSGNDCLVQTGKREEKRLDRVNSLTKGYFISPRAREYFLLVAFEPWLTDLTWLTRTEIAKICDDQSDEISSPSTQLRKWQE
jgi:hypothetical protein